MIAKGFTRHVRPLELLSREQVDSIHRGTLHVLESTGLRFESKRALKVFEDAGCQVDDDEMRVRFPPGLVEECLRQCPSSFAVEARNPRNTLRIGGNTVYFYNSVGLKTVNLDTWEPRTPTLSEQHEGIKVLDALDNLHFVNAYAPYMEIEGIPPRMLLLESMASRIRNTTKVTSSGYSHDSEMFAIRMAEAAGIKFPGWVMAGPPLTYFEDACVAAFRFVEAGFPIILTSGVSYGGTGPATIAGSTITNSAELIAGAVLIQLIKPGTGVLAADFTFPMDMRTGSPAFGSLGSVLHAAMFAQIWRGYGIPVCVSTSGYPSAKRMDYQTGYEKAISGLTAALSGANVVSMHGGVSAELTYHPVQSVLDNDVAGMIGRLIEGVEVTQETLAIDLIQEVGPIPGMYLDKAHTRKWWKREQFIPQVADRLTYPEWMRQGKKGALDYAEERVEEILATYVPTPLSEDQDKEIDRILEEARRYYRERDML